jgi:hypothetical protein
VNAWERDQRVPSVYNYSFGIQQNLGFNTVLDASYVGNVGRHLLQKVNLNQLPYGTRFQPENADPANPNVPLPDNFLRPFPGYGNINYLAAAGTSNYNALQATLNRRFSSGFQFGIAYTWSKSMGLSTGESGTLATYQDWDVWNYGPLGFDQTHMFVANYIWELPRASKLWDNPVVHHLFTCSITGRCRA